MKKRFISAIFILLILFAFLALRFVSISIFDILTLSMTIIGGYEISDCNKKSGRKNFLSAIMFFAIIVYITLTICFLTKSNFLTCMVTLASDFVISLIFMGIVASKAEKKNKKAQNNGEEVTEENISDKMVTTIKIMVYPVLLFSTLYFVNNMSIIMPKTNGIDIGLFLITSIFSVSMATDTFAFFVGKALKGPRLAPKISPNKTISGAIGGFIFGICAILALYGIFMNFESYKQIFTAFDMNFFRIMLVGALTSIFNQLGDLYESYEKRKLGIKDFGNIIPGHGGVMDRVDGVSFVSFITFFVYAIILG